VRRLESREAAFKYPPRLEFCGIRPERGNQPAHSRHKTPKYPPRLEFCGIRPERSNQPAHSRHKTPKLESREAAFKPLPPVSF
jgi:hypothetical protein